MEKHKKTKLENFVAIPRKIRDNYIKGELNRTEFNFLIWTWLNANPVNGFYAADYSVISKHLGISEDNARKIACSLRKKKRIFFKNHRGKGGSFPIYPVDFLRTSGTMQTWKFLQREK